ncbi:MAG: recombination mediator RecR [Verrucomicrobiales bacterium]
MKKAEYPEEIQRLIAQLKRLPGIGPRSAERIAMALLQAKGGIANELAQAIANAASQISACERCGFFQSESARCMICAAAGRDSSTICIVEQATDVIPIERSAAYHGLYHVLGGKISPLNNVHPEDLRIEALLRRLETESIQEIILAIGSDIEGEATAHYLADALSSRPNLKLTRLAQGLPAGGGLEHIDELTLSRALSGRRLV